MKPRGEGILRWAGEQVPGGLDGVNQRSGSILASTPARDIPYMVPLPNFPTNSSILATPTGAISGYIFWWAR